MENEMQQAALEEASNAERGAAFLNRLSEHFHGSTKLSRFLQVIERWREVPKPIAEVHAEFASLLNNDPVLLDGIECFFPGLYLREIAHRNAMKVAKVEAHRIACERQSGSPLMQLPRELRDKIWKEAGTGNIIHVIRNEDWDTDGPGSKFSLNRCTSHSGLQSLVCPPGMGDHINCTSSKSDPYVDLRLVCRQMYLEMPDMKKGFISQNALQFADLADAEDFLFRIPEEQRAAITHLRIPLPYDLVNYHDDESASRKSWRAVTNYFSNCWDRKSLHMGDYDTETSEELKSPIYFYYSNCYYQHNADRLGRCWQVGRDNTSWDVTIADLRCKNRPRLDLAIISHPEDELERRRARPSPWRVDFESPPSWLLPLLQFKQYEDLKFDMYDEHGKANTPDFDTFVVALKEYMSGPVIGPSQSVYFCGMPYSNGDHHYSLP